MTTRFKPDYCSKRDLNCDKCEMFYDGNCLLLEEHLKILEMVNKRGQESNDKIYVQLVGILLAAGRHQYRDFEIPEFAEEDILPWRVER